MKSIQYLILFFVAMLVMGFAAHRAQAVEKGDTVMIMPSFLYYSTEDNYGTTDKQKRSLTNFNVGAGYKFSEGFYLGLTYLMNSSILSAQESGVTTESKDAQSAYGPTAGFFYGGLYATFSYLFGATSKYTVGTSETTYSGGSAMKFDLGYLFSLHKNFALGPQITCYNHTYKKAKIGSAAEGDLTTERKVTDIAPYIAFAFMF